MTLRLSPEVLERAYDYLAHTAPFDRWNMPPAEDVIFRVVRTPALRGWYAMEGKKHVIGVSRNVIGHTLSLMYVMAHEMVHLHQEITGMCRPNVQHNAAFNKLAARVCHYHGFDPKLF